MGNYLLSHNTVTKRSNKRPACDRKANESFRGRLTRCRPRREAVTASSMWSGQKLAFHVLGCYSTLLRSDGGQVHNPVTIRSVTNPAVRTGSVSSLCCGGLADDPLYYPDYLRSWHEAFPSFEEDHPTLGVVAVRLAPGQQPRPASVPTKSQGRRHYRPAPVIPSSF